MGRIPDDEVSGQTNLKLLDLLGRCDMPTLPLKFSKRVGTHLWKFVEHIWTSSLKMGHIWTQDSAKFPKTFGTSFATRSCASQVCCLKSTLQIAPRSTGHVLYKRWGSVQGSSAAQHGFLLWVCGWFETFFLWLWRKMGDPQNHRVSRP